jgi:hypothetical protein
MMKDIEKAMKEANVFADEALKASRRTDELIAIGKHRAKVLLITAIATGVTAAVLVVLAVLAIVVLAV